MAVKYFYMEITKNTDFSKFVITDEFLARAISKDIITGEHFYYIYIDTRNLSHYKDVDDMLRHYEKTEQVIIGKYARMTLDADVVKRVNPSVKAVYTGKNMFDKKTGSTYMLCMIKFMYIDGTSAAITPYCITPIYHDYISEETRDEFRQ